MSTWRRFAGDDHVCGHEHPAGCFFAGPEHGESSAEALERAFQEGSLVTNGLVYAELAPKFETQKALDDVLEGLSLRILGWAGMSPFPLEEPGRPTERPGGSGIAFFRISSSEPTQEVWRSGF